MQSKIIALTANFITELTGSEDIPYLKMLVQIIALTAKFYFKMKH